jgi:hypothetical protein
LTDTTMSDTMPGIAAAFPDTIQIFRRDRKMTFGDHVNHDPNDWQAYIRADAVQAQIDAAVKAERERCAVLIAKFDISEDDAASGVRFFRDAPSRVFAAAIRKGDQP